MTLQPAAAARNGLVYLAWSNSASLQFGSSAGSDVWFTRSPDGGRSWGSPVTVNPSVAADKHHVLPSLAIDEDPNDVHISYYTQQADASIDLDMANSHDRGDSFPVDRTVRVTQTSFNLPPTNIRLTDAPNFTATNFDRQIAVCTASASTSASPRPTVPCTSAGATPGTRSRSPRTPWTRSRARPTRDRTCSSRR
jgi:hypothetical protein